MPRPKKTALFEDDAEEAPATSNTSRTSRNGGPAVAAPDSAAPTNTLRPDSSKLLVNRKFAERYEERKRKQDLSRARELGWDGQGGESSSEEDSDVGEELTTTVDKQIMETINLIRNKDPRVYNPEIKFFAAAAAESADADEGSGAEEEGVAQQEADDAVLLSSTAPATSAPAPQKQQRAGSKKKPLLAKDVLRQQLVEAAERGETDAFADDEELDADAEAGRRPRVRDDGDRNPKVYDSEQAALRQAFIDSVAGADGGDSSGSEGEATSAAAGKNLLRAVKKQPRGGKGAGAGTGDDGSGESAPLDRDALKGFLRAKGGKRVAEHAGELVDPEGFLTAFMRSSAWREAEEEDGDGLEFADEAGSGAPPSFSASSVPGPRAVDDSEDEAEVEKADTFEAAYNFRFEEPGGGEIVTYSRAVEGSVRRKDSKRKEERGRRKERQAVERAEAEAETRRLVNLRRAELKHQMKKIRDVAGGAVDMDRLASVLGNDLDGEFDPAAHDAAMARLFGDEYYAVAEEEPAPMGASAGAAAGESGGGEGEEDSDGEDGAVAAAAASWVYGDGPRPSWAGPSAEQLAAAEGEEDEDVLLGLKPAPAGRPRGASASSAAAEDGEEEEEYDPAVSGHLRGAAGRRRKGKAGRRAASALSRARAYAAAERQGGEGEDAGFEDPDDVLALGFEDVIAGGTIKTRFKYAPVSAGDFGLSAEEILLADDEDLNSYVGLRKLAPYREQEWVVPSKVRRRAVEGLRKKLRSAMMPLGLVAREAGEGGAGPEAAGGDGVPGGGGEAAGGEEEGDPTAAASSAQEGEDKQRRKKRRKAKREAAAAAAAAAVAAEEGRDAPEAPVTAEGGEEDVAAEEGDGAAAKAGRKRKRRRGAAGEGLAAEGAGAAAAPAPKEQRGGSGGGGLQPQHHKSGKKAKRQAGSGGAGEAQATVTLQNGVVISKSRLASYGV